MIPYGKHFIDDSDISAVVEVLKSSNLTQGSKVDEFQQAFADYVGVKYAVAVSSGTAALHLANIAAGVGVGDSIVTSPITFIASANAGLYVGAEVCFADVDQNTINISPDFLNQVFQTQDNIKVVIPVHFAGLPCDMLSIKKNSDQADVLVIEDAAHALGSIYADGSKVGSCTHSLMTTFSFHPVKAIAAGEGGMITTNNEQIYHRLLRLRSHGVNKEADELCYPNQQDNNGIQAQWYYEMQELGYNYRITDIQCALGLSQLKKLDLFIKRRKEIVEKYNREFSDVSQCRPAQIDVAGDSGHHIYVLRINFEYFGISRQLFIKKMKESEIWCQVHYIPVPMHPMYKQLGYDVKKYKNALEYYNEAISIPLYYSMTDNEQIKVIQTIKGILGL